MTKELEEIEVIFHSTAINESLLRVLDGVMKAFWFTWGDSELGEDTYTVTFIKK